MNNLSLFSVADRCPFIVSTAHVASACGHLLMELFVSCWGGSIYRVLTVTLICMRLLTKERKLDMPWPDRC